MIEQAVMDVELDELQNEIVLAQSTRGVESRDIAALIDFAERVEPIEGVYDPHNLFCVPLPSGLSAFGRLTPNESQTDSGARRYYLETLLADRETFQRCGANPRTLISAALNGLFFSHYRPGKPLLPFSLDEQLELARFGELREVVRKFGARALTALVQATLENERTTFVSDHLPVVLVSCVFSLLPVSARRSLAFSAGVRFRDEASIRLVGASKKGRESLGVEMRTDGAFLDLRDVRESEEFYPVENPWCVLVESALNSEDVFAFYYAKLVEEYLNLPTEFSYDERVAPFKYVSTIGSDWINELMEIDEEERDDLGDEESPFLSNDGEGEEWKNGEVGDLEPPTDRAWRPRERNDFLREVNESENRLQNDLADLASRAGVQGLDSSFLFSGDKVFDVSGFDKICEAVNDALGELKKFDSSLIDDEERPSNSTPTLSPFATLSAEFPERSDDFRTLHSLASALIKGENRVDDRDAFDDFWRAFCQSIDEPILNRVREVYLNALLEAIATLRRFSPIEREKSAKKALGCNDVFEILTKDWDDEDSLR
ncbi:MAG: hypothetical protein IJM30_05480 [Thermoguttaceae bacterium]|nr:hypothetical protein [Thermoguttaceae bacterium]